MERARNYCFTSYDELPIPFDDETMQYLIQQREICPATSREHWQGTVIFKRPKTFAGLRRMLPNCHIEKCRNLPKAIDYCRKEESRKPGTTPIEEGEHKNDDWTNTPYKQLWEERPTWMLRNWRAVREHHDCLGQPSARPDHKFVVYYGPPGTGKSNKAFGENPEAYSKDGSRWWDGYRGQETVIWDDFAGTVPFRDFLRWVDIYPMRVETKGGFTNLAQKTTIATTNVLPMNWYPNCDYSAVKRRIFQFYEFDETFTCKQIDI